MFFVESDKPTLKAIFDNIRNYIICGTMFAISVWVKKIPPELLSPDKPGHHDAFYMSRFYYYGFLAIAIILTVLNAIQTYVLIVPTYFEVMEAFKEWSKKLSPRWQWLHEVSDELANGFGLFLVFGVLFLLICLIQALYFAASVGKKA